MEKLVLVVHVLTALSIVGLILLQQGKGAEVGASFGGGASGTVFGSAGSGNFFSRLTAVMATVFFVTSFGLAILARQSADANIEEGLPEIPAVVEQPGDVPEVTTPEAGADIPQLDAQPADEVPSAEEAPAAEEEAPEADEQQ
ncbi:preprotein translocase subunit SecG [Microbulbifer rhizosphaerae]|uniref:Protein-export membrane protein SecG n=1 Tax=Microbulbifer rhizosphaerae TaxID=1562603 RepID=A0A7W4Z8X6_9GAMM|nr:preprotein translocase subunit SecG [Microbulbifer rhizosphaerae]MBB3059635.1 preprotein translocase subunit SecG [Microbulbifer rhizosphaerae]